MLLCFYFLVCTLFPMLQFVFVCYGITENVCEPTCCLRVDRARRHDIWPGNLFSSPPPVHHGNDGFPWPPPTADDRVRLARAVSTDGETVFELVLYALQPAGSHRRPTTIAAAAAAAATSPVKLFEKNWLAAVWFGYRLCILLINRLWLSLFLVRLYCYFLRYSFNVFRVLPFNTFLDRIENCKQRTKTVRQSCDVCGH